MDFKACIVFDHEGKPNRLTVNHSSDPAILSITHTNDYSSSKEFMADLDLIYSNAKQFNGEESVFANQAVKMINAAKEFLSSYKDHLAMLEQNIGRTKEKNLDESPGGYGDGDEWESAVSETEEGEVQEDGQVEMDMDSYDFDFHDTSRMGDDDMSRDRRSSVMDRRTDEEPEEGEYRSDDNDSVSLRGDDNAKSEIDDNSHQAVEAMLMMSSFNTPEPTQSKAFPTSQQPRFQKPEYLPNMNERRIPLGSETPRNIHDDLAVSDSDNEDDDPPPPPSRPNPHRYSHQPPPPSNAGDDDGLWF